VKKPFYQMIQMMHYDDIMAQENDCLVALPQN
jgi:hypothetical protein